MHTVPYYTIHIYVLYFLICYARWIASYWFILCHCGCWPEDVAPRPDDWSARWNRHSLSLPPFVGWDVASLWPEVRGSWVVRGVLPFLCLGMFPPCFLFFSRHFIRWNVGWGAYDVFVFRLMSAAEFPKPRNAGSDSMWDMDTAGRFHIQRYSTSYKCIVLGLSANLDPEGRALSRSWAACE